MSADDPNTALQITRTRYELFISIAEVKKGSQVCIVAAELVFSGGMTEDLVLLKTCEQ